MRSDVSEFLATTKPSLVSLLVRQAQWEEYHASPRPGHRWLVIGAPALGFGLVVAAVFLVWFDVGPVPSAHAPPVTGISPPFLAYDNTETIGVMDAGDRFIAALALIGQSRHAIGTFERLDFRLSTLSDAASPLTLATFMDLASIRLPAAFAENAIGSPQFFRYQTVSSVDFGFAVELRNAGQVLASLRAAEPSLARDLQPLFLGILPPPTLAPFENRTYRNIDFRYLAMDAEGKRGIGYVYLSAKRLLIITTSAEAMTRAIERLFEASS